ncbi:hypothetical protein M5W98_30705, partial [Paenibacillus apiarius]|nr:hypothetical protein [Paenibacillus apiarius]
TTAVLRTTGPGSPRRPVSDGWCRCGADRSGAARPSAPRRFSASDQLNTAREPPGRGLTASEACWS